MVMNCAQEARSGSATWARRGTSQPLDLSDPSWWLAFDLTNERAPRRLHDIGTLVELDAHLAEVVAE